MGEFLKVRSATGWHIILFEFPWFYENQKDQKDQIEKFFRKELVTVV